MQPLQCIIIILTTVKTFCALTMSQKTTPIFSYGSNSMPQLRGRVLNNELVSVPAYLDGWTRVFCNKGLWGDGGVASLAPCATMRTYGAVVHLNDNELQLLNGYEKGYTLTPVQAMYSLDPTSSSPFLHTCFCYLADDPEFQQDPAEPYLTAIHVMLREHYDDIGAISISKVTTCTETLVKKVSYSHEWNHPGVRNLRLDSVCVEVNSRRKNPWKMPAKAFEISDKLITAGIHDTNALIDILSSEEGCMKFQSLFVEEESQQEGTLDIENILQLFQRTLNIAI